MTFSRKITLISSEQKNGSQGKADRAVKTVYAKVSEPGVTAKYAAKTAGYKSELTVYMWRREYSGQSVVQIDGKRYHVETTGAADSDLHIKLILARGG